MSFYTALTGLNGSQADISASSNNIANVGTTGFKRSRAEFVVELSLVSGSPPDPNYLSMQVFWIPHSLHQFYQELCLNVSGYLSLCCS